MSSTFRLYTLQMPSAIPITTSILRKILPVNSNLWKHTPWTVIVSNPRSPTKSMNSRLLTLLAVFEILESTRGIRRRELIVIETRFCCSKKRHCLKLHMRSVRMTRLFSNSCQEENQERKTSQTEPLIINIIYKTTQEVLPSLLTKITISPSFHRKVTKGLQISTSSRKSHITQVKLPNLSARRRPRCRLPSASRRSVVCTSWHTRKTSTEVWVDLSGILTSFSMIGRSQSPPMALKIVFKSVRVRLRIIRVDSSL